MTDTPIVDTQVLREQVRETYRAVAVDPDATYHFHTGRPLAGRLGYDPAIVHTLPDQAVQSTRCDVPQPSINACWSPSFVSSTLARSVAAR